MSDNRKKGKGNNSNTSAAAATKKADAPSSVDLMSQMEQRLSQMEEEVKKRDDRERQAARYAKAQLTEFTKKLDAEGDVTKKLALAQTLFYKQCLELKRQGVSDAEELLRCSERIRTLEDACEKEHRMGEHMQGLARKLQGDNALLRVEAERIVRDESEKRASLLKQFQAAEDDINAKIRAQEAEKRELIENYEALRKKSLDVCSAFEAQEKKLREKELENKLLEARLTKESESTKILLSKFTKDFTADAIAKEQLNAAKLKASQLEAALKRSVETLTQYKESMETAIKKIKALEEENGRVAKERDRTNIAVMALTEQLKTKTAEQEKTAKAKDRLEGLCRIYQARLKEKENEEKKEEDKKEVAEEEKKEEEKKDEEEKKEEEKKEEEVKEEEKKEEEVKEVVEEEKKDE